MPVSSAAATNQSNQLAGGLASQLDAATPILVANNWATKAQLDNIRIRVANAASPVPTAGRSLLGQFLLDNRLLPRDQISDLDAIMRNQGSLPQFQLQRKIGAGGMGTVFLAKHLASGRLVALKTINARLADDKDFVERFHREARALENVGNQHIAEIIASGENEGTCWLAMEYIDGPSLMSMLKEHRVLPEHYALHLTRQVAEGLGHVWQKAGLVHRDIKPENVLVVRSRGSDELFPDTDVAKLIDFGLVKSNNDDERLTQTGMTIGTPLYMSPEQVRGEKLDCRSDIYGLGATLFHLVTGVTPFSGSSPGAIMSAHLTEQIPDPGDRVPSLSKATRSLIMTAMSKSADSRYLTFEALIHACEEALESIDHKSGSMPRLLRKPMVLKNPVKRSGEYNADGQDVNALAREAKESAAPAGTGGAARREPVTGMQRRTSDKSGSDRVNAGQAPTVTAQSQSRQPPSAALVPANRAVPGKPTPAAGNGQVTRPSSTSLPPAANGAIRPAPLPDQGDQTPLNSAAYVNQPPSPGTGLLPWIALGFAVLALIVYLAMNYL